MILIIELVACVSRPPSSGTSTEVLQRAAVASVVDAVSERWLPEATQATAQLSHAVEAWSKAPADTRASALMTARLRYEAAFVAWQAVELFQFGPLGAATRVTEGQGLRDEVYSWPTVNLCRIDAALVAGTSLDEAGFDAALVTSKGFAVVEYLLFNETTTNACPSTATINTDGSWAALAATDELEKRKASWARGAAAHLARTTAKAATAWSAFGVRMKAAGDLGSAWRTPKDALDDVFAGLFFVDQALKDMKLGAPSGITSACLAQACPELAESPYARLSTAAVLANLRALRFGFTGGDGTGFDDLLVDRGAGALKDELLGNLDVALASAAALEAPVQQLVVDDLDRVHQLHAQVKAFTDVFKTQFVTTLALRVPKEGAGDND